jgi:Leucine-rich repeat (LRR) protein
MLEKIPSDFGQGLQKLTTLKLAGNDIKTFEAIDGLKSLTSLQSLDLAGNPICQLVDYDSKVRLMFSTL